MANLFDRTLSAVGIGGSLADRAYAAAAKEIEAALKSGSTTLELHRFARSIFEHLERIPPQIGELGQLLRLDLRYTQVTDIAPLSGLAQLQSLDLRYTQVTDIAPLSGLAQLQSLDLRSTQVTDIAPLSGLAQLQSLSLWNTQVTNIAPLSGLAQLQFLYLNRTKVADLGPIKYLTNLRDLEFRGCEATKQNSKLRTLSEIKGDRERTETTLAYLRSLDDDPVIAPPPKPIVPDPPPENPLAPVEARGTRLDLKASPTNETGISADVRRALQPKLRAELQTLERKAANTAPDIADRAYVLATSLELPITTDDGLLDYHLEAEHFSIAVAGNAKRAPADRIPGDVIDQLELVVLQGTRFTSGCSLVKFLQDDIDQSPPPEPGAHDAFQKAAEAIAENTEELTQRVLDLTEELASQSDPTPNTVRRERALFGNILVNRLAVAGSMISAGALGAAGQAIYVEGAVAVHGGIGWLMANAQVFTAAAGFMGAEVSAYVTQMYQALRAALGISN
ncbi:MAG: leucine-rich repeat domain-containing protein [Pseudomonadota bacterium]